MKKTTKILLVLAAVVAMAIGAVSTVMAADEYPEIAEWIYNEKAETYSAKDANGETIVRGWATDEGRWYFFDSGFMLTNAFVTWNNDVYYLDGNGCMAVGWIEFDKDLEVKALDKVVSTYDNVCEAFAPATVDADGEDLFTNVFTKKTTYETMWCYFDEHGVMANHEWIEAWGLHYFIYGAYCVMDNYFVAIDLNGDGDMDDANEGIYGFSGNGNMHVGWIPVDYEKTAKVDATNKGTPYEGAGKDAELDQHWTYYYTNGKQVDAGWEKIGEQWTYFIDNSDLGKMLVVDTLITDANGKTMYIDADGYMVKGSVTFTGEVDVNTLTDDGKGTLTEGTMSIDKNDTATFSFSTSTGAMEYGIIGNYYYNNTSGSDVVYVVKDTDVVTGTAITVAETTLSEENGEKVIAQNFFLKTKDSDKNDVYYYFEYGKMIKNDAVKFGDIVILINADGTIYQKTNDKTIGGVKYKQDTTTITLGASDTLCGYVKK